MKWHLKAIAVAIVLGALYAVVVYGINKIEPPTSGWQKQAVATVGYYFSAALTFALGFVAGARWWRRQDQSGERP